MRVWGSAYIVVGVLAGYESLIDMMQAVNGAMEGWWPPITLAAAILLCTDGVRLCFPRIRGVWLIAIAGSIPLAICSLLGEWPLRCWVFSAALVLLQGLFLKTGSVVKRDGICAFACLLVLTAALANSTVHLALHYWKGWWDATFQWTLAEIVGFLAPLLIPWSILLVLFAHSVRVFFGGQRATADPSSSAAADS
jgi:hypothetical protein